MEMVKSASATADQDTEMDINQPTSRTATPSTLAEETGIERALSVTADWSPQTIPSDTTPFIQDVPPMADMSSHTREDLEQTLAIPPAAVVNYRKSVQAQDIGQLLNALGERFQDRLLCNRRASYPWQAKFTRDGAVYFINHEDKTPPGIDAVCEQRYCEDGKAYYVSHDDEELLDKDLQWETRYIPSGESIHVDHMHQEDAIKPWISALLPVLVTRNRSGRNIKGVPRQEIHGSSALPNNAEDHLLNDCINSYAHGPPLVVFSQHRSTPPPADAVRVVREATPEQEPEDIIKSPPASPRVSSCPLPEYQVISEEVISEESNDHGERNSTPAPTERDSPCSPPVLRSMSMDSSSSPSNGDPPTPPASGVEAPLNAPTQASTPSSSQPSSRASTETPAEPPVHAPIRQPRQPPGIYRDYDYHDRYLIPIILLQYGDSDLSRFGRQIRHSHADAVLYMFQRGTYCEHCYIERGTEDEHSYPIRHFAPAPWDTLRFRGDVYMCSFCFQFRDCYGVLPVFQRSGGYFDLGQSWNLFRAPSRIETIRRELWPSRDEILGRAEILRLWGVGWEPEAPYEH